MASARGRSSSSGSSASTSARGRSSSSGSSASTSAGGRPSTSEEVTSTSSSRTMSSSLASMTRRSSSPSETGCVASVALFSRFSESIFEGRMFFASSGMSSNCDANLGVEERLTSPSSLYCETSIVTSSIVKVVWLQSTMGPSRSSSSSSSMRAENMSLACCST